MIIDTSHKAATTNYDKGRGGKKIDTIVIHSTNGYYGGTIAWFKNPVSRASVHYLVGLDGKVAQMVDEADTAWHASHYPTNQRAIGIECVDDLKPTAERTEALYLSVSLLVRDICERHNLPINRDTIKKHGEIASTPCPWTLDIDRIVSMAAPPGPETPKPTDYLIVQHERNVIVKADQGVNIREIPSIRGRIIRTAEKGVSLGVSGWTYGEEIMGQNRWWALKGESGYFWAGSTNVYPPDPSPTPPIEPLPPGPLTSATLERLLGESKLEVSKLTSMLTASESLAVELKKSNSEKDAEIGRLNGLVKNHHIAVTALESYETQITAYKEKLNEMREKIKTSLLEAFDGWELVELPKGPTGVLRLTGYMLSLFRLIPSVMASTLVVGWSTDTKIYYEDQELPDLDDIDDESIIREG